MPCSHRAVSVKPGCAQRASRNRTRSSSRRMLQRTRRSCLGDATRVRCEPRSDFYRQFDIDLVRHLGVQVHINFRRADADDQSIAHGSIVLLGGLYACFESS